MDGERFDALARSLVGPRRAALRALAGAALGAVLAPVRPAGAAGPPRPRAAADPAATRRRPSPTACKIEQKANNVTTTLTAKLKRQKLSLTTVDATPLNPGDDRVTTTTIKRGRALLLRIEQSLASTGRVVVRTAYGPAFRGIDESVFVVEGGTISGSVGGRTIVPFPVGAVPDTLRFQDGQPAPEMGVSEQVAGQIEQILARAAALQPDCAAAAGARGAKAGGVHTSGGDEFQCLSCKGGCVGADFSCGVAVANGCAPSLAVPFIGPVLYAACLVSGAASCVAVFVECMAACRGSRACCPVLCGTLPDWSCCFGGAQCLTFGTGFGQCCEVGETPCLETTCCRGGETCMPDGSCCPSNRACGQECCGGGFGERCCGNRCCPGGRECCGGTCCPAGDGCCGDRCCPQGRECCNGTCCPQGDSCCNGRCCASGVCCNGVCCTPGESCDNGRCERICRCPSPDFCQFACPNEPGYPVCCESGRTCCSNGRCCGPFANVCCPDAPGGCCPFGQTCCGRVCCEGACGGQNSCLH